MSKGRVTTFEASTLLELAAELRYTRDKERPLSIGPSQDSRSARKTLLIYAQNGTGKTQLSMAFKNLGKDKDDVGDTLYFNAFTEDLFSWENDFHEGVEHVLKLNRSSAFLSTLDEFEMETRIREHLQYFSDFDFSIDPESWEIRFSREEEGRTIENIKISRGEESIFVWCFFLTIADLALDPDIEPYNWVKYIYIDDPISSLDEQNAVGVAVYLYERFLTKNNNDVDISDENIEPSKERFCSSERQINFVISTHHILFFNTLYNLTSAKHRSASILRKASDSGQLTLEMHDADTPFFLHLTFAEELLDAANASQLCYRHIPILRAFLEATANFHGFCNLRQFLQSIRPSVDVELTNRTIQLFSHGTHAGQRAPMLPAQHQEHIQSLLTCLIEHCGFNPALASTESAH